MMLKKFLRVKYPLGKKLRKSDYMNSNKKELIVEKIFLLAASISIISVFLIVLYVFSEGLPFILNYGVKNFVLGVDWKPSSNPPSYGIFPMIIGSLYTTLGAVIIGVPTGILTATYLSKFSSKKIYAYLKPMVNLMAGIPSIIYGFFALTFIVPISRNIFGGTGMNIITSSILLGIMILPTIINMSEASINAVDNKYYEASIALGASHERSVLKVILPAAKSGIVSSIILAIGRAIGETMAVVLVAGNQARIPDSLNKGVRTLTTNIVLEMGYAPYEHRLALIGTASILLIFILIINLLFLLIQRRGNNG